MKIYRVYHPFHESDESGTREYGYFSTVEKAKERLLEVLETVKKEDADDGYKFELAENGMSFREGDGWETFSYYVEEIEVDKKTELSNIGYT